MNWNDIIEISERYNTQKRELIKSYMEEPSELLSFLEQLSTMSSNDRSGTILNKSYVDRICDSIEHNFNKQNCNQLDYNRPDYNFDESTSICSVDTDREHSCMICLSEFTTNTENTALPCSHTFHTNCVARWVEQNRNCPICRIPT